MHGTDELAERAVSRTLVQRSEENRRRIADCFPAAEQVTDLRRRGRNNTNHRAIARAEQFLNTNLTSGVSRSDLADAAGVSIRTLSRLFLARHGTGPMGFFKAQRLDAAHRYLLASAAGSTSITDVAVRYGFNHLGKFAMEYNKAFGELPSTTLKRSR